MIHEFWSVCLPMVGMFHSVLICCSSRISQTCLLLWFPVRRRVHVYTCLFHQPLNVCYLGAHLPHPFRINCWCRRLQIRFFHKFGNRFLTFCDKFSAHHMLVSFWSLSVNSIDVNNLASSFSNYLFRKTTHLIYLHFPIFIY
jgi:hypothetical protein